MALDRDHELEITAPEVAVIDAGMTLASELLGIGQSDPRLQARLVAEVARVSLAYRRQAGEPDALRGDPRAFAARAAFFLPRDFPKVRLPLGELRLRGRMPKRPLLRVLDFGAGLGTTGLSAAIELLRTGHAERVTIDALDSDPQVLEHAGVLVRRIASTLGLAIELRAHALSSSLSPAAALARVPVSSRGYELALCGLVLNELPDPESARDLIDALCDHLADDGALIVLEPALRTQSRKLQALRDALVATDAAPYVFAPCLHTRPCPLLARERDWCHMRLPLQLPERLSALAEAADLRTKDLTFSYLTLLKHKASFADGFVSPEHGVDGGSRLYRVVSSPLASKGKLELWVCGTTPEERLRRLDRQAAPAHAALEHAQRGEVLAVTSTAAASHGPTGDVLRIERDARVLHALKLASD